MNEKRQRGWVPRYLVAAIALCLIGVFAFGSLFTTFAFYDDEGYFLLAYRDFLMGRPPYDAIYSPYGPYTFLTAGLFTAFDPGNVTPDGFRWITLPVWVAIPIVFAGVVWRLTGNLPICIALFLLIGLRLNGAAEGVGHPQLWVIAALGCLLWVGGTWLSGARYVRRAFWAGLMSGVILLFKINIGVFVLMALGLAITLQLPRGRIRTLAVLTSLFIAVCLIPAFMSLSVANTASERLFISVYVCSLVAIIFAASRHHRPDPIRRAALLWLMVGVILAIGIGIGGVVALGTTGRGLLDGLIFGSLRFSQAFHDPFLEANRNYSLLLCELGVGWAAAIIIVNRVNLLRRQLVIATLKSVAGAGLLLSSWYAPRVALSGSLLFLWILVFDSSEMENAAYLDRMLLVLLAVLYALQIFPIAGSQVDWATVMPTTAAAVLIADGMQAVSKESAKLGIRYPALLNDAVTVGLVVILSMATAIDATRVWTRWRSLEAVNLPGTSWLRLPPAEATRLTYMTDQIAANCRTLLSVPGLYSFSLWSGVSPIEQRRFTSWPFTWGNDVLRHEFRDLQKGGCALVSEKSYGLFRGFTTVPQHDDLLTAIRTEMTPIASIQDLTLYRGTAP